MGFHVIAAETHLHAHHMTLSPKLCERLLPPKPCRHSLAHLLTRAGAKFPGAMRHLAHELWEDDMDLFEVDAFMQANIAEVRLWVSVGFLVLVWWCS